MVDVWHIMIGSNRNPSTETEGRRGGESVGGGRKREKGKGKGSGLDITTIAGDEKKKKGSGCEACVLRRAKATSLLDGKLTPSDSCSRYESDSGGGAKCPWVYLKRYARVVG